MWDTYTRWRDAASERVKGLYAAAANKLAALVERDPDAYRAQAESSLDKLAQVRKILDSARGLVAQLPADRQSEAKAKWAAANQAYMALASGALADAASVDGVDVGIAPVLVVGGISLSAAAVAWLVDSSNDLEGTLAYTAAFHRQLELCTQMAREGREIPEGLCDPASVRVTESQGSSVEDAIGSATRIMLVGSALLGVGMLARAMLSD